MNRFRVILICAVAIVFLNGCIYFRNPRFPSEWGMPIVEKEVDISGIYVNYPIFKKSIFLADSDYLMLSWKFFDNLPAEVHKSITHVEINQFGDRELECIARRDNEIVDKRSIVLEKEKYEITSEGLVKKCSDIKGENGISVFQGGTETFFKTPDGSLICKKKLSGFGMVLVLPVITGETYWFKFEKKKGDSALFPNSGDGSLN